MRKCVAILFACSMSCVASADDTYFGENTPAEIPAPVSADSQPLNDSQSLTGHFFSDHFPEYHDTGIPAEWELQHKPALINYDAWQPAFSRAAWQSDEMSPDDDVYALAEARVSENLAVFLQLGQVDQQSVNAYEYYGTGIMLNNRWQSGDSIGMSVMRGNRDLAQPLIYSEWITTETSWELTYIRPLVTRLNARTSVYYIQNPADSSGSEAAIAAQVRFYYTF